MAKVKFLGPLSNKDSMDLDIRSLLELKEILKKDDEIAKWLDICSVAINDELVFDINRAINENDNIVILPPVCGG